MQREKTAGKTTICHNFKKTPRSPREEETCQTYSRGRKRREKMKTYRSKRKGRQTSACRDYSEMKIIHKNWS